MPPSPSALVPLGPHTWMFPPHPDRSRIQPSVGVVIHGGQTLLYDAGNGPTHAQAVLDALAEIDAPPVTTVIYSHFHWDHIFGAAYLADHVESQGRALSVIGHASGLDGIAYYTAQPWGHAYIERTLPEKPWYAAVARAIPDWHGFRIVPPSVTFDDTDYRFDLDGLPLELEHVGGKHCLDSVVLKVPDDGVMFLADCFYAKPDGIDTQSDRHMVQRLRDAAGYETYVDGHTGVIWRSRKAI